MIRRMARVDPDSFELVPLSGTNRRTVNAAARLHKVLLGRSPIPRMGKVFMKRFYYSRLVKSGLIEGDLFSLGGKFVGFVAYTRYPHTFMVRGAQKYFLELSLLTTAAVLKDISVLKVLWEVASIGGKRIHAEDDGETAEILTFGVLEANRGWRDPATGRRISQILFETVLGRLRSDGFKSLRVLFEADNERAERFYTNYGGTIDESSISYGRMHLRATYELTDVEALQSGPRQGSRYDGREPPPIP